MLWVGYLAPLIKSVNVLSWDCLYTTFRRALRDGLLCTDCLDTGGRKWWKLTLEPFLTARLFKKRKIT
jgi:hypothetical protein